MQYMYYFCKFNRCYKYQRTCTDIYVRVFIQHKSIQIYLMISMNHNYSEQHVTYCCKKSYHYQFNLHSFLYDNMYKTLSNECKSISGIFCIFPNILGKIQHFPEIVPWFLPLYIHIARNFPMIFPSVYEKKYWKLFIFMKVLAWDGH